MIAVNFPTVVCNDKCVWTDCFIDGRLQLSSLLSGWILTIKAFFLPLKFNTVCTPSAFLIVPQ